MASILKWQKVNQFVNGTPVSICVTGNVDTRVFTRYFWLPKSDKTSEAKWDRNDGVALLFDTSLVVANQQNHLGFSAAVAPVVGSETSLILVFQVRQANTVLLEQEYRLATTDPNVPILINDGITL